MERESQASEVEAVDDLADVFPAGLADRDQWVCWRTQTRSGKETKVPLNPANGRYAAVNDPETWGSLAEALDRNEYDSVAGLGFVFTDDDPFVGIDLDDCRDPITGDLDERAESIVSRLDSYSDVSPSGTGVHVIVRGDLPEGRSRRGTIEMYDDSRFFTMTGELLEGLADTVEERSEALAAIHSVHVAEDESDGESSESEGSGSESSAEERSTELLLDDEELIDRATSAKNGEKFERLWRGDTSGYESHSEADMALCALLAFWTGADEHRVDRLFRQSGLYREKWDERHFADGSTYGEKTVQRAVEGTDETYSSRDEGSLFTKAPVGAEVRQRELRSFTRLGQLVETLTEENQRLESDLEEVRKERDELRAEANGEGETVPVTNLSMWKRFRALFFGRF